MRLGLPPLSIRTRLTLWYTSVLCAILLVISALSYAWLGWSLRQDLDASLLVVGQVIRDTGHGSAGFGPSPEDVIRRILGPELYDKFFQLVDPQGRPGPRSASLQTRAFPLSDDARRNAVRGEPTFETLRLSESEPVIRLLTLPIMRNGQPVQLVQVGMSLARAEKTLRRYLETLLVLVPVGLLLAVAGGAVTARAALAPVDEMSRSARRITAEDLSQRIPTRGTDDELDHLAGTLSSMLARLEGAFGQMRRFAADAAHELRTPLTILRGEIEVALRAERSVEEYRRVLRSSLEEVERLVRLAEDLLLLSRSTAGVGAPKTPVELEPLFLEAFDVGVRLAEGTRVSVRLGPTLRATVVADAAALRRALLNLIENAVKYTPAGGVVDLALSRAAGAAEMTVRDTGVGIPAAEADRIFEPFVRLDAARARETGGTGLGLAIARSIVVAHGGTLSVDSTPGAGSQFTIRLPLA